MKPLLQLKKLRRIGIFLTIILIAGFVILSAWLINHFFDYRINDAMIAAIIAAVSLIYEINKSKKLNEAEFLIHLNSLFITNPDYKVVYNLLSVYDMENEPDYEKEISNCDISNYLTLFETFYILLRRKVIDMKLLDDLFAYRFFLAVHNPYMQRRKLAISPKNFKNIFRLERMWLDYRHKNNINENYFTESYHLIYRSDFKKYLEVFNEKEQKKIKDEVSIPDLDPNLGYEFVKLEDESSFNDIYNIQKKAVIASDQIKTGMLRANTKDMLKSCLSDPHVTIAIKCKDKIVGFGILYDPNVDVNESIKNELDPNKEKAIFEIDDQHIMHIKLVVIDEDHQGHHLQYHMNKYLEKIAKEKGAKLLFTTVSPYNVASVKNTFKTGFTYKRTVKKYAGAIRLIYAKFI
ncbi:MAG: GNAT family N-acetyltransferase [Acholeplasmataceae bacterium]|nr:GNAT family N-acetyltransferase [Acholeplasmataceae bacterium]